MKYVIKLLLFSLIIVLLSAFSVSAVESIDVGINYGSTAPQSVTLSGQQLSIGMWNAPIFSKLTVTVSYAPSVVVSAIPPADAASGPVFINSEGVFLLYPDIAPEDAVTKTVSNTAVQIQQDGVLVAIVDLATGVSIADWADNTFVIDGREYAGHAILRPNAATATFTVINRLDVESYLCGVLPYEMSTGWPIEALKAQAVAARNYVANNSTKHRADGFDLCNTTHCQVYRGISGQAADCTQAVWETAGIYLYYQDTIAQTFYFSSSGGRTENVKDVWGSSFPYLVSVEDPYEKTAEISSANWNYTISRSDLEKSLSGYNLGSLSDLSIVSTTEGGRAKVLKATGALSSAEIKASDFRTLIGNSLIKGTYFAIVKSGGADLTFHSSTETAKNDGAAYVLSDHGAASIQNVEAVLGGSGIQMFSPSFKTVTFVGKGYGHGVGMSQWGARGMAEAGFTYDQILTHYFVGTEVRTEE